MDAKRSTVFRLDSPTSHFPDLNVCRYARDPLKLLRPDRMLEMAKMRALSVLNGYCLLLRRHT